MPAKLFSRAELFVCKLYLSGAFCSRASSLRLADTRQDTLTRLRPAFFHVGTNRRPRPSCASNRPLSRQGRPSPRVPGTVRADRQPSD
jgi:hypothetical protein